MKSMLLVVTAALALLGNAAFASEGLAKSKNCMACHTVEEKKVGPAFKDIAAKYAKDSAAVGKLAKKIREGGVGVWGQVPMPYNPQVNEQEAQTLARWVLSVK